MTIFSSLYGALLDTELGDADRTVLFTTDRRKSAVNKGMREFADLTECVAREATITITTQVGEYNLLSTSVIAAGDFVRFAKNPLEYTYTDASSQVTILAGDDLVRRDPRWLDTYEPGWRSSTVSTGVAGLPSIYYLRPDGGNLYLGFTLSVPSLGSSASASVRVPYLPLVPVMSADSDEPFTFNSSVRTDLRPYHQAVVHYAAAQLEKLRRDVEASGQQLQLFLGYVTRYAANLRVKGGGVIMQARRYYGKRVGGWSE